MQIREARRAEAAGALVVGGRLRLGRAACSACAQLGRAGRRAQSGLRVFCTFAREIEQGMVAESRVRRGRGPATPAGRPRVASSACFKRRLSMPLSPPRSERHSTKALRAQQIGGGRAAFARGADQQIAPVECRASAASVSSLDMGRCSAACRQRLGGALARIAHVDEA